MTHLAKRLFQWVKTQWLGEEETPPAKVIPSRGKVLAEVSKHHSSLRKIEQQVAVQPVALRLNLTWVTSCLEDYRYQIDCLVNQKDVQVSELEELQANMDHFRKEFKSELQTVNEEQTRIAALRRHQYSRIFAASNIVKIVKSENLATLTVYPSTQLPVSNTNGSLLSGL